MSLLHRLIRLPLRLIAGEKPRAILSGPLKGTQWIPQSATHGAWLGTYERELQEVARRHIPTGGTVLDIGANVGFYTLLASRLVGESGRVVSFEPLPRNFQYLRRHLELNGTANVDARPLAIAEESGSAFLAEGNSPAMAALAPDGVPVRVESLDGLAARGDLPVPAFVKVDVEGAESRVLAGARSLLSDHRPTILLAAHGWQQKEECTRILESLGYSVASLRDGSRDGDYPLLAT